jgi:hypothetical protein
MIGNGTDGARALVSALNKLNLRNFDRIAGAVASAAKDLGTEETVRAIVTKSTSDGGAYSILYARLLSAVPAKLRLAEGAADAAERWIAVARGDLEGMLEAFADRVRRVAGLLAVFGSKNVSESSAVYDAFCEAQREKKELTGAVRMAAAVSVSASADAASALLTRAAVLDAVRDALDAALARVASEAAEAAEAAEGIDVAAADQAVYLALEAADNVAKVLAEAAAPARDPAVAEVRRMVASRARLPVVAALSARCRFKAMDVASSGGVAAAAAPVAARATAADSHGGGRHRGHARGHAR